MWHIVLYYCVTVLAILNLTKDYMIQLSLLSYGNEIPSHSDIARSARPCIPPRKHPKWCAAWGSLRLLSWRAGRAT